ncbi:hypothetical protein SAY86_018411 [Trapa natans]|uniref:Uncharacterized protein n=1 Tax=Trapa natans TaxID=22666 RepID=A0AAN7LJ07_TRANT|nr:hypothetical protein SAY86_018411 [Trapa natans]
MLFFHIMDHPVSSLDNNEEDVKIITFTFETLFQTACAFEELVEVRSAVQDPIKRIEVAELKRSRGKDTQILGIEGFLETTLWWRKELGMNSYTLRVPLQWWHRKHDLWKILLSAASLSTR